MKNFFTNRWHLHLLAGAILITPIIWLLVKFDPSFDFGLFWHIFIAGFLGAILGLVWEAYYEIYHEAPFDMTDVYFTIFGAMAGTLILFLWVI